MNLLLLWTDIYLKCFQWPHYYNISVFHSLRFDLHFLTCETEIGNCYINFILDSRWCGLTKATKGIFNGTRNWPGSKASIIITRPFLNIKFSFNVKFNSPVLPLRSAFFHEKMSCSSTYLAESYPGPSFIIFT